MSTENVQLAIRRNIELAFIKKGTIEFKGDRSEARILVSICQTNTVFAVDLSNRVSEHKRFHFST